MKVLLLKLFIIINIFAFIFGLVIYNIMPNNYIPKVLLLKDMFIFLLSVIVLSWIIYKGKIYLSPGNRKIFLLIGLFILFLFVYFLLSGATLSAMIYLRKFTTFLLILVLFAYINYSLSDLNKLLIFIKKIIFFVAIFSLFEYPLSVDFWKSLNLNSFWLSTGVDPWADVPLEHSGRFFSWDLYWLIGEKIKRTVSIFADPTLLAAFYYSTLPFILLKEKKNIYDKIILLLAFLSFALSMSKSLIVFILVISIYYKFRSVNSKDFIILNLFILTFLFFLNPTLEHGAFAHVLGISSAISGLLQGNILGYGLGKGGNYAIFEGNSSDLIGGESGLGSMISQIGILSIMFVYIIYKIIKVFVFYYKKTNNYIFKAGFIALVNWYIIFLFSESSLGITGNAVLFTIVGILLSRNIYKEVKLNYD